MNTTTFLHPRRVIWKLLCVLHVLATLSLLFVSLVGHPPPASAGWFSCPAVVYVSGSPRRLRHRRQRSVPRSSWLAIGRYARRSGPPLICQVGLWLLLAGPTPMTLVVSLPLVRWLLGLAVLLHPRWGAHPTLQAMQAALFSLQRLLLVIVAGAWVAGQFGTAREDLGWPLALVLGSRTDQSTEYDRPPAAKGCRLADGTLEVQLSGQFVIRHKPVDEFERRMFLLFLRRIRLVDGPPKQPFLRQEWLAEWFGTLQELISRWEGYRRAGDWRRLMSRQPGAVLSLDEQRPILQLWALNFWWSAKEVAAYLASQGIEVSVWTVETVAKESGFWWVRQRLLTRFEGQAEALRPKDGWLVNRLLRLVEELLAKLEAGQSLTVEERVEVAALLAQGEEPPDTAGGVPQGRKAAFERGLPPRLVLERLLFGWWEEVDEEEIRCPICQGTRVARKSRQGRPKRFRDRQGQVLVVEVQRYYCRNRACPRGSFTLLPSGLVPYSHWPRWARWHVVQEYVLERGCYRWTAQAMGISVATAYRWVGQFGGGLLPIAALFGVVRSSGVVSIDEKWVKVPKNDKPQGKHRHWMYVHFAVDVYTYDLLHIAIYPYDNTASVHAFLLELQAKGYRPAVIVTDLRQDYGAVIAAVFPKAEHHECIFHALQNWSRQLGEVYGANYRDKVPEAAALQDALQEIFKAKTKRTSRERYEQVMALRKTYLTQAPAVACVFDSLEKHFPKLVNAIESERIPRTNNSVESVIRRFEQHYRGFCGFESIETAQCYLAVWELVYRCTPFSADAQPRVRGKCPLELAGYDLARLPMIQALRGAPPHPCPPGDQPGGKGVVPSA